MGTIYSPDAVFNQSPPLENYNLFDSDCALKEAVRREGGGWIDAEAHRPGELLGKPEIINLGVLANRFTPELRTHDRCGYRIDEVTNHPAYHALMRIGIEAQTHSLPWVEKRSGAHVARAALVMLRHQIDEGTSCPLTMTFASNSVATIAAGTRDGMGTAGSVLRLRSSIGISVGKRWCSFRDGHDRAPGR